MRRAIGLLVVMLASCGDDGVGASGESSGGTGETCTGVCPTSGTQGSSDDDGTEVPEIATFAAAPTVVPAGLPTQVTWSWTYANSPVPEPTCTIDNGVGDVASDTSTSVTLGEDTVFTLTCTNAPGSDSAEATVTVESTPIIPPDRLPPPGTWEGAGVEGGIPERNTICAVVTDPPYNADATGAVGASAAIQAAIDACPEGEVVHAPAGTYLIDAVMSINKGISLRGDGASTVFEVADSSGIRVGDLSPWPPPKANAPYTMPLMGEGARGSTSVDVADTSAIEVGKMIMIDEEDDPDLVWTKPDAPGRYRASMHMVESKTPTSVTFRPPLPIDYTRTPQLSWFPDLTELAGVESIKFVGTGENPFRFIDINSAWNSWVLDCEFSDMPDKTIMVAWSGHIELRRLYLHDQTDGGPDSEGLDLLADVNWSLIVDNICVAAGFPQINIGDGGPNPYYSGGFGNVIAYNYCVDSYYTDPPDSPDAGKMTTDIGTNHSPHTQYNLVEGNVVGKFGSDAYHGSGSHTVLLRNVATASTTWAGVSNQTAVQLDRRNLHYSLVGNVFGQVGMATTFDYATESGWSGSTIYRLGYPDVGNDGFSGTFPPTALLHADGGPRDLYVDRTGTEFGTTLIEGNWDAFTGGQDWTIEALPIPDSYFLPGKPEWFGSLAWPPVDPTQPVTDDPTIIPAGYRYLNGTDP